MTSGPHLSRSLTTIAAVLGLLGAAAVLIVLIDAPGSSRSAGRDGPAARQQRTGQAGGTLRRVAPAAAAPVTQPSSQAARTGLRLMSEAATACRVVAFHGYQITAWWGTGGSSAAVIQVWHRAGDAILARSSSTADPGSGPGYGTILDQSEIMTLTPALLALIRRNYVITYAGRGSVDGRPVSLVAIRSRSGALAARFWLDAATRLPLRRELFGSGGRIFSEDAFIGLSVGAGQVGALPAVEAQPWRGSLTDAGLAALRARSWPLPGALVGGLARFSATQTVTGDGQVVELSYSDGLSVISLFVQRGELPRTLPGWQRITIGGAGTVYATDPQDRSLTWAARGYVYTMISDAAPGAVDEALRQLPHGGSAGFWERMSRGFRRIGSWANPFG
ncbi:MAG TPA: sigma-E factor regulatory protein RseB domain-containing protein [Streptosporangiaceae bacterium]